MIKFEKIPQNILTHMSGLRKTLADDKNIIFAYLFGGLARGTLKPLSDVDIAVYLGNRDNLAEYKLGLFARLSSVLGTSEIDLVVLNTAPISLTGRILQRKQVLVDKEPFRRHSYESLILREFFDFHIKEETIFKERYGVG